MYSEVKKLLTELTTTNYREEDIGSHVQHSILKVELSNNPANRMFAYHVYEALRQGGAIEGTEKTFGLDDFKELPLKFGEHAELKPLNIDTSQMVLHLDFGNKTPKQVALDIAYVIAKDDRKAEEPTQLIEVVPALTSLARVAKIPADEVKAVGSEVLITSKGSGYYGSDWSDFSTALNTVGLVDIHDVRTFPTVERNSGNNTTRLPMAGKSPNQIASALFDAEVALRQQLVKRSWSDRVSDVSFVSGQGLRKQ